MLPSPAEIEYFLEISKTLNLSRASERLGITQPTLSMSVKRLEQNIGAKLLIRSKSGVQLTKFGQRFVGSAQAMIEEWEKLRAIALSEKDEVQGQYTIGSHPSVALYSLSHFLPKLLHDYPKLHIELVHDISRHITEKVISYKIDFGIVINPISHPDLVIIKLAHDCVTLWTTKHNRNLNTLICDQNLLQTQDLSKQIRGSDWEFERIIHCSDLQVITDLVESGGGVGIIPTRVAEKAKGLKRYGKNPPVYEDVVTLVYRYDAQNSLAAKTIITAIKNIFI
ncbi:LysR family transcriptional regulator [Candidatus Uabimicrobium sp. HlEnr_7]|uniref:LysR family transcriptional regulator n=1 Tax=Candidatus Uabimicrobium helgolandensis TaxID=3095367 RepID=UPI003558812D